MTNAQTVFDLAMHLMDETNHSTGKTDTVDTREYRARTVPILNVLRTECYPYSDTYQVPEPGRRGVCRWIESLEEELELDDGICQGVLPYGLAAHLLLGEDDERAAYFNQRYEEKLRQMGRGLCGGSGEIGLLYGGIEKGEFGRWE